MTPNAGRSFQWKPETKPFLHFLFFFKLFFQTKPLREKKTAQAKRSEADAPALIKSLLGTLALTHTHKLFISIQGLTCIQFNAATDNMCHTILSLTFFNQEQQT
jgi:hypothetical protein